jgi:hypothetical protein
MFKKLKFQVMTMVKKLPFFYNSVLCKEISFSMQSSKSAVV